MSWYDSSVVGCILLLLLLFEICVVDIVEVFCELVVLPPKLYLCVVTRKPLKISSNGDSLLLYWLLLVRDVVGVRIVDVLQTLGCDVTCHGGGDKRFIIVVVWIADSQR